MTIYELADYGLAEYGLASIAEFDELEIALHSTALFDQYDETPAVTAANDDCYDNLYPCMG